MKVNGELKNAQVEAVTNTAARPAAGQKGRILYDLALSQLIYDNGSAWVILDEARKYQTKYLLADYTPSSGFEELTDLTFNNLPVGYYRFHYSLMYHVLYTGGAGYFDPEAMAELRLYESDGSLIKDVAFSRVDIDMYHESSVGYTPNNMDITLSGSGIIHNTNANAKLKIYFYSDTAGAGTSPSKVKGHATAPESYVTVEEIKNITVTTDWN